jgi:Flp pilus assembly pilin Flp
MLASRSISDRLLYRQVATLNRARDFGRRLKSVGTDEQGQTPTEYLMIVGLMAAVIVMVFTVYFWPTVKTAASTWVAKVSESILGTKITK